jgi:hypothetical protein
LAHARLTLVSTDAVWSSLINTRPRHRSSSRTDTRLIVRGHQRAQHLLPKGLDERGQRSRLLPATRVVQEVAGKWRAPVFEHTNECAALEVRRNMRLETERQASTVEGGADEKIRRVDDH